MEEIYFNIIIFSFAYKLRLTLLLITSYLCLDLNIYMVYRLKTNRIKPFILQIVSL